MATYIIPLVLGIFFGFSLNKAGLTKYTKIVNVFRLTDMAVLKFMMTALVVSMTGLFILRGLGLVTFPNIPATYIAGNVVGGLIFGVGMALSGYCPGTCVAGSGEGKLDYLIPGLLGFLVGAVIYGLTYPLVFPVISAIANLGSVVIPDLLNISPYLTVLLFALMAVLLFYLIDRAGLHRKEKA
ncbi:MAG TPA: YeeE/YedE thiosulfate transporter family protein [Aggregatilineaceae bacterium]|nr:YeeE/YedE thiosulfate transporter family protein [Aggregatilineaceae bacterium]